MAINDKLFQKIHKKGMDLLFDKVHNSRYVFITWFDEQNKNDKYRYKVKAILSEENNKQDYLKDNTFETLRLQVKVRKKDLEEANELSGKSKKCIFNKIKEIEIEGTIYSEVKNNFNEQTQELLVFDILKNKR